MTNELPSGGAASCSMVVSFGWSESGDNGWIAVDGQPQCLVSL
jgi:hypothetical protein